ncbi:phage tail sheath C-terminal domain-containing protein [Meridianimarinicoccus sp. RP-17]|uniref:phage tail sheath C-terminal domain-containing protein n=1 Tax=Meridianimarinicoccus zhengii TaxID=2056810 RepID=UPI000DABB44F|nr:phage tail sheath C-terminal domain-containing protein [Phycocomes zhengii]
MTTLATPGLYRQPVEPVRAVGRLARGDIAVFLGYCRRGPLGRPVRVHALRQAEEIFGAALDHGYLWHALKGFFETGGRAAYVIRVATTAARAAEVTQRASALSWRARASFPWLSIDPRKLNRAERAEAAAWIQVHERQVREEGPRSADPGVWGNDVTVTVTRAARARTEARPGVYEDGYALSLASLAGIELASVLELSQTGGDGTTAVVHLQPREVDPVRGLIRIERPLSAFHPGRSIRVTSVEFDLEIRRAGLLEQSFIARAPDPAHSEALSAVSARSVEFAPVPQRETGAGWGPLPEDLARSVLAAQDWADPAAWPDEGSFTLSGGTDGLSKVRGADFRAVLAEVRRLPDAALIAAPDLVLPDSFLTAGDPVAAPGPDCASLDPLETGQVTGTVFGTNEAGETVALGGVTIEAAGLGQQVVTDAAGRFALTGLPLSFVTLRLSRDGFEPLEYRVQPSPFASSAGQEITMTRITVPRALGTDEIATVQAALGNPVEVGPYKVAIVDPVTAAARLDDLLTWRSRLGDQPRLGFCAPWLRVGLPGGGVTEVPPSGHVCGAFAAAERDRGIQRSGANLALRHCEGVTLAIDDAAQAGLNPVGINAIRAFPGRGIRLNGTRSLGADPEARFLSVRRILDTIEKSLERALHWMVFEPNTLMTRAAVASTARVFLDQLWRDGVLAGDAPEAAFSVKCDEENNPADSREAGQLVVDIGVAPAEPYEFILFRLGAAHDAVKVTETGQ